MSVLLEIRTSPSALLKGLKASRIRDEKKKKAKKREKEKILEISKPISSI
jgi:hypothetical protein